MINTYRPGTVIGTQTVDDLYGSRITPSSSQSRRVPEPSPPPEVSIPNAINYFADYSGCGYWRMIWPDQLLTAYQHVIVHGSTQMLRDEAVYRNISSIRLQRQASTHQLDFFRKLVDMSERYDFNVIYEIDDLVFREDIPDYNKYKFAFDDDKIRSSVMDMMRMSHEITVTCDEMKEYYISKTGNTNVTVIPNYAPRFWLDGKYHPDLLEKNYDRHVKKRKKPRILYAGSGAHFDVENKVGYQDDFQHVEKVIRKTCNKIQWVFMGGHPVTLTDLVRSGKIEFHKWKPLYDVPEFILSQKINCMIAPLRDNIFNKCKSDIKYLESSALGIPVICQDLVTYKNAPLKFNTGDEMIDQLTDVLKDKQSYMKHSRKHRLDIEDRWLELPDNLLKYKELYTSSYGSPDRKLLNSLNNIKTI